MGYSVHRWNKIIYGNKSKDNNALGADEFWKEFKIKSYPKFSGYSYYHIPGVWADEVKEFIWKVQKELGDNINFIQIKEKFCQLVVYFNTPNKDWERRVRKLQDECVEKLIEKGVYPPKEEKEND